MRTLSILAAAAVLALTNGCMLPNYARLIPENKSAHIKVYNPVYGYIEIDTRVAGDTNQGALYPLPAPVGTATTTP